MIPGIWLIWDGSRRPVLINSYTRSLSGLLGIGSTTILKTLRFFFSPNQMTRRPVFKLINSYTRSLSGLLGMGFTTVLKTLRFFLSPNRLTTCSPAFPPELERHLFETCALNNRETCLELVLVARRVRDWYVFVLRTVKPLP
jgi:hypothetical protein